MMIDEFFDGEPIAEKIDEPVTVSSKRTWRKDCSRCGSTDSVNIMSDNGTAICKKCLQKK